MSRIILLYFIFVCSILNAQKLSVLSEGIYITQDDFYKKKEKRIEQNLRIKNRFGSLYYKIKNNDNAKLNGFFSIVRNDTIFVQVDKIQENLRDIKKVFFASNKFDYLPAKFKNEHQLYFEILNTSKSWKYIGIGVSSFKIVIYDFKTNKFIIFMTQADLRNFLSDNRREDLAQKLSSQKKLDLEQALKLMQEYFGN